MFLGGISQGILNYQRQQQQDQQQQADLAYRKMLMQQMQDQMAANREAQARAQQANQTQALMIGAQGPQPPAPGQASVPMMQPGQQPPGPPAQPSQQQQMSMMGASSAPPQQAAQRPTIPPYRTVSGSDSTPPQQAPSMQAPPPLGGMQGQGNISAPGQLPTPSLSQVPQLVNQMLNAPSVRDQAIKTLKAQGATNEQIANWLNSDSGMNWIAGAQKSQDDKLKVLTEAQKVGQDAFENSLKTSQQGETERHNKMSEKQRGQELGMEGARLNLDKQKFAATQDAGRNVSDDEKKLAVTAWIQNPAALRGMDKVDQKNVIKWAGEMGITADDIIAGRAKAKFDYASATASGHRAGQMATVEAAIPDLIASAKETSAKVPRNSFVPLNELMMKADASISDPDLLEFKMANQALSSEYQTVISRGGSNVFSLKEAMANLQMANSPEAYNRALDRLQKEVDINVKASNKVRENIGNESSSRSAPKVGDVQQGYRFKGGNPADPNSWEKQ